MKQFLDTDISNLVQDFKKVFISSILQLSSQDRITIWLSGWSSVNHFYSEMENIFFDLDPDIRKKIYFCFLDERVVSISDPESNYFWLKTSLLDSLIHFWYITKDQILLPDFSRDNFAENYYKQVRSIDIWLFWVGPDGHTCSLFPHHELLDDTSIWYLEIHDSPKPPSHRITISQTMLKDIPFAFVFFMGESKKQAYYNFVDTQLPIAECPVKFTQECRDVYVFSDLGD